MLNHAKLNGAELKHARLNGAKMSGSEMNSAILECTELNFAELNEAELNNAMLAYAQLNCTKLNAAQLNGAQLNGAQLNNVELLREIVYQLGVHEHVPEKKSDILHRLTNILNDNYSEGRHTVIIVDEAHLIDDRSIFEELRLLLNFQKVDRFLLTLILVGQPELREKIAHLKQFDQRISTRYHLKGLKKEETKNYIHFGLPKVIC